MEAQDDESSKPTPRITKVVTLKACRPGHADAAKIGTPIGIVSFIYNGQEEQPLMLMLSDVRKLANELIEVLGYFDDPTAKQFQSLLLVSGGWRDSNLDTAKGQRKRRRSVSPSVLPTTPRQVIQETEVWDMVRMVRNVADHERFMRLIGATPIVRAPRAKKRRRKR